MKSLSALLCMILITFITSSLCADTDETSQCELDIFPVTSESRFPMDMTGLFEYYDLDRVEEYIDMYYGIYYKSWEKYLTGKQREFAGRFGLTNIFFKPNFKYYQESKVVLSRSVWSDRIIFRYMAPLGDVRDFEFSVSLKPYRFITLSGKQKINGDGGIAIAINKPFGRRVNRGRFEQRTKHFLGKLKILAKSNL